MYVNGIKYKSIWLSSNKKYIEIIDQRYLPFKFVIRKIKNINQMIRAIKEMYVRGAPLIGTAAAFGLYLASLEACKASNFNEQIEKAAHLLAQTRPTAVNLKRALKIQMDAISLLKDNREKIAKILEAAQKIARQSEEQCRSIGLYGVKLIQDLSKQKKGETVQILTHCNAGALGCIDHGTATAPIYEAQKLDIPVHVWIDETRPRNQGGLTAWEFEKQGIACTIICDNTGGHLMQRGMVDIVIVGADRVVANGDCANKIGTYLKALAAYDNKIPFYVALPHSTLDFNLSNGSQIPIESRNADEVLFIQGIKNKNIEKIRLFPEYCNALNYSFDITPARLISAFITDKGIYKPGELSKLASIIE